MIFITYKYYASVNSPANLYHLVINVTNISYYLIVVTVAIPFISLKSSGNNNEKIIFVTSTKHTGNLGGLSGADSICQNLAKTAGLPGNFQAVMSDSTTNAKDRFYFASGVSIQLVDDTLVANGSDELWDAPAGVAVNVTELNSTTTDVYVWSDTVWNGTLAEDFSGGGPELPCNDWADETNSTSAIVGCTSAAGCGWIDYTSLYCDTENPIYCIEE